MDIKKLLDNEFSDINDKVQYTNELVISFKLFNIDSFTQNLGKYRKSLESLLKTYKNTVSDSITLYESRLDKEALYAQKDSKYNNAIKLYDGKKFYDAYVIFNTIKGHRDTGNYINKCMQEWELTPL